MGSLRFFFALCVLLVHFGLWKFGVSIPAVESFFIISGFYMALVLHNKYSGKKNAYSLFIKNRILRIFPVYWLMLILAFLLGTFRNEINFTFDQSSIENTVKNIFIITNINYFIPNGLGNYSDNLLNGPSWTLGIEFLFYLIAPFLIKSKKILIITLLLTLVLNRVLIETKFFQVFYLFFLGWFSYLFYTKIKSRKIPKHLKTWPGIAVLIACPFSIIIVLPVLFPEYTGFIQKIYYFVLMLIIPFVFTFTVKNKVDSFLGDLSYPIYISHTFVIQLLLIDFMPHTFMFMTFAVFFVFLLSFTLYKFVDVPIREYKSKNTN